MMNKSVIVCAILIGGAVVWSLLNADPPPSKKEKPAADAAPPASKPEQPSVKVAFPAAKTARPQAVVGGMGAMGGMASAAKPPQPRPRLAHSRPKDGYKTWTGVPWIGTETPAEREFERRADKALRRPISVDFIDTPLIDVGEFFEKELGVPVQFDLKAIEEPAVMPTETTVTLKVSQVTAEAALNQLLSRIDESLTWILCNQVLLITTKTKAEAQENYVRRVYPVADLVAVGEDESAGADFDSLIDLITSTVAPDTWGDAPGQGSIKPFESPASLVVSHTANVQDQITRLLKALRIGQAMHDGNTKVLEQLNHDDGANETKEPKP